MQNIKQFVEQHPPKQQDGGSFELLVGQVLFDKPGWQRKPGFFLASLQGVLTQLALMPGLFAQPFQQST